MKAQACFVFVISAFCGLFIFSSDSSSQNISQGVRSSSATNVVELAASRSCKIDSAKFPKAQTDVGDLTELMYTYISACHADLSAIDSVFEAERRDGQWAGALEHNIKEVAAKLEGLTMKGDCRRSLCRIDFASASLEQNYTNTLELHNRLLALLRGTPDDVGWINVPTPSGIREYFFSKNLPAPFVEPFLNKMRE